MNTSPPPHEADHWDSYWSGTRENAAHKRGGPQEAALNTFWQTLFDKHCDARALLDVACGNGAVVAHAQQRAPQLQRVALDYSVSAGVQLHKRYPGTLCVAADASRLPFADASFDLVCSQFGVEYAGLKAFAETARVVAAGGTLAVVAHLHDGAIHHECAANLQVAQAIVATEVLTHARLAFGAGFALNKGQGDAASFKAAEAKFTPTVRALEQVLTQFGSQAADGLAQQIYKDIAHMYQRMSAFDAAEVLAWVDGMDAELAAYCGRMRTMCEAALDASALERVQMEVEGLGFTVELQEQMTMGAQDQAGAWALIWRRR